MKELDDHVGSEPVSSEFSLKVVITNVQEAPEHIDPRVKN